MNRRSLLCLFAVLPGIAIAAPNELRSGPQLGERPLPFTSNAVTGPNRGKQYCYICELKDEPAVLVFARDTNSASAALLRNLREAVQTYRSDKLFGWMVFLSASPTAAQTAMERQVYGFARENGATDMPMTVLGDPMGPPGYQVHPDAAATLIAFRSGKVVFNRAFTAREWSSRAAESALKDALRTFNLRTPSR